jgi:hypothetical protein
MRGRHDYDGAGQSDKDNLPATFYGATGDDNRKGSQSNVRRMDK